MAHTLPAESAATTVLRRCGFTHVADIDDPEQGTVWRWEASLDQTAAQRLAQRCLDRPAYHAGLTRLPCRRGFSR